MEKFVTLTATAAYLPIANIDTDMLVPKQYLKTIHRSGLGKWLFAALRYDAQGGPVPDFVLNRKPQAKILLAGENFGCGSSREHAPWALADFGIRAVIAPSFADIFYNNSGKNGLLLVRLGSESVAELAKSEQPITLDLEAQKISCDGRVYAFDIESDYKNSLLNGLDDIESSLAFRKDIEKFESVRFARQPWLAATNKGSSHA